MLNIVGLGLGGVEDVTLKGLKAIRRSDQVILQHYTSILPIDVKQMEDFYQKKIIIADREFCQLKIDQLLKQIQESQKQYSFLVVGDPFGATTHSDLFLRASKKGIKINIIHNAGIIGVVGVSGLQAYRFGQVSSIPLFNQKWRPYSFLQKILKNLQHNLHTLCLLDIKVKERSDQNILKNKQVYQPPRYMTINQAIQQILQAEASIQSGKISVATKGIGMCRIGCQTERICCATLGELRVMDLGLPLHSLIICSQLHSIQKQMFQYYAK